VQQLPQVDAWQERGCHCGDAIVVSAETYDILQEAINIHLGDEMDGEVSVVKDWVLVASVSDIDAREGREQIVLHRSPGTALYAVSGLLNWGAMTMAPEDFTE